MFCCFRNSSNRKRGALPLLRTFSMSGVYTNCQTCPIRLLLLSTAADCRNGGLDALDSWCRPVAPATSQWQAPTPRTSLLCRPLLSSFCIGLRCHVLACVGVRAASYNEKGLLCSLFGHGSWPPWHHRCLDHHNPARQAEQHGPVVPHSVEVSKTPRLPPFCRLCPDMP